MSEALQGLFMIVRPIVGFFDNLFSRFYSGGFNIFGIPFYLWIIILVVVGFFFDMFTEMLE